MNDGSYITPSREHLIDRNSRIAIIGSIAAGLLSEVPDASVQGVTSRGVFIRLASSWVIFLSTESYRGPLTLNLDGFGNGWQNITIGMPVRVEEGRFDIPATGQRFLFDQASVWQAPPLPRDALPVEQRMDRLMEVTRELLSMQKEGLFSNFLAALVEDVQQSATHARTLDDTLSEMRMALLERKIAAFTTACGALLGLGPGLTPSGDDLIAGLALALSRWGGVLYPDLEGGELLAELTHLAYHKTSLLSANLIECACQGQADERLVLALDGIISGAHSPAQCAAALAGWGNTSGVDALAGMALAVYPERHAR